MQSLFVGRSKGVGYFSKYISTAQRTTYKINIPFFINICKSEKKGKLGMINGLMFGKQKSTKVHHSLKWFSIRSKIPVKLVASAVVLAKFLLMTTMCR